MLCDSNVLPDIHVDEKVYRKPQKMPKSQRNHEEEQSGRYQVPQFQTIPQSYNDQNSMALALKEIYRSME